MLLRRPTNAVLSSILLLLLAGCAGREVTPIRVEPPRKAVKVALVLGAGAAKGFAHVGVLKVIEANRVPVHMVVGTRTYVDGGVVSPVAVDVARRMGADAVIAVDITGGVADATPDTTLDTIFQSINIMYSKIADAQRSRADVVILPKVGNIASGDFTKRHEAILEGEKAAQDALPKIQALLRGESVR